jgi:hypothetical protein
MSIKSREDANKYYQIVNELVDEYMSKGKIRPSSLKRYLQPGGERFKKFLIRNKLNEITGIDRVLSDVIEDRANMESDGVLTFENFKFFESDEFKIASMKQCLYKGIEKADLKMEKVLADVFDTNLGSIDIVDTEKHCFKVEDEEEVFIYSKEDIDIIGLNILDHLYDELCKKDVVLVDDISINLSDLVGKEAFEKKMYEVFTEDFLLNLIGKLLDSEYYKEGETIGKGNYFIWKKA